MNDIYGHVIFPGEFYLKGHYLVKTRSKMVNKKQFKLVESPVLIQPDESFEHFIDINDDLSMENDAYLQLVERTLY